MMIHVKITPNASKNQIVGWEGNLLRLKIKGIPEKGRVNEELTAFLASELDIPKSKITIVSGRTSRLKRVAIDRNISLQKLKHLKLEKNG